MAKYIAKKPDEQGYIAFTPEENAVWKILYDRQIEVIKNRACDEYIEGLKKLDLAADRVPQCKEVSAALTAATGWSVVPVAAMIPINEFFLLLANKQFPAASFVRIKEELDYLKEPDIFHEYFGHCPLLTNQAYADFVEWYGRTALGVESDVQSLLARLFWFTIEFGLVQTAKGLRIYGGGILSSYKETIYALESDIPQRVPFDLMQVLSQDYRYDIIQHKYFILNDLSELFQLKTEKIIEVARQIVKNNKTGHDFLTC